MVYEECLQNRVHSMINISNPDEYHLWKLRKKKHNNFEYNILGKYMN